MRLIGKLFRYLVGVFFVFVAFLVIAMFIDGSRLEAFFVASMAAFIFYLVAPFMGLNVQAHANQDDGHRIESDAKFRPLVPGTEEYRDFYGHY